MEEQKFNQTQSTTPPEHLPAEPLLENLPEQPDSSENELDLDPDITQFISSEQTAEPIAETVEKPHYERTVEPLAPISPIIERQDYQPMEREKTSRGMKVFAILVAALVLLSGAVTTGYFLGISRFENSGQSVDLAKKPNPDEAKTVSQVYQKANPSVVGVYVYNQKGIQGMASGVIYSKEGYIITNDHIYADVQNPRFKVYTHDGKMHTATFVAGDVRSDLAVLKIDDPTGIQPAVFGNSKEVAVGETVVAVGRPNGATLPTTASEGIVSATDRRIATTTNYNGTFIQTDSAINPGSSGGALYNLYGQVVGITSAKLVGDEYEGVGFAIPTAVVKPIVDSLIKHKKVKNRAKLGISYLAIDPLTAEMTDSPCGLKISEIDPSSDLYGKVIQIGDVITHVNGIEITDSNLILEVIETSKPGDTINLRAYSVSKKKSFDISVKLLADQGSSSYLGEKSGESTDDSSSKYNASEFTFPNGD